MKTIRDTQIEHCKHLAKSVYGDNVCILSNYNNHPKIYLAKVNNGVVLPRLTDWMLPSHMIIYLQGVQAGLELAKTKVLEKVPNRNVIIVIKSDSGLVYEPNVNMPLGHLVDEYISGLCLNEENDKECADWLNKLMESDSEIEANIAVKFIAEMWDMDVELKTKEIESWSK